MGIPLLSSDVGAANFSINVGDSILICFAAIARASGNKVADDLGNDTALVSATNKLHVSSHEAKLGNDVLNNIDATYSIGFESRAQFAYFDRPNMRWRIAMSVQDVSDPFGPPTFAGIASGVGTGTDAGIGTLNISAMFMRGYMEKGPIHIIRWPSGTAPAIGVIETAMEWMWHTWSLKDKFVLYPPLVNY